MAVSSGDGEEGDASATLRCPQCGSALDDVAKMSDKDVLKHVRSEVYRDLLRSLRTGNASHQELAIARGILRDNNMYAEEDPDDDEATGDTTTIGGEEYSFKPGALSETEGG
jgi:hypothetical protein